MIQRHPRECQLQLQRHPRECQIQLQRRPHDHQMQLRQLLRLLLSSLLSLRLRRGSDAALGKIEAQEHRLYCGQKLQPDEEVVLACQVCMDHMD